MARNKKNIQNGRDTMYEPTKEVVVAIRFGDNDFHMAITAFLKTLGEYIEESTQCDKSPFETGDKEKALRIVNESLYAFYRVAQNQYTYNDDYTNEKSNDHMRKYLTISMDQLILGQDAIDLVMTAKWNNYETFILDMRLPKDQRVYAL